MSSWPPWHDGSPIRETLRERIEKEREKKESPWAPTDKAEAKEERRDDHPKKPGRGDDL
jgi:hypothetical protein